MCRTRMDEEYDIQGVGWYPLSYYYNIIKHIHKIEIRLLSFKLEYFVALWLDRQFHSLLWRIRDTRTVNEFWNNIHICNWQNIFGFPGNIFVWMVGCVFVCMRECKPLHHYFQIIMRITIYVAVYDVQKHRKTRKGRKKDEENIQTPLG